MTIPRVLFFLLGLAGCARHEHVQPAPAPPAPALEGAVAFTWLRDPTPSIEPRRAIDRSESASPAELEEILPLAPFDTNGMPLYPAGALSVGAAPAATVVRIVIGTDGTVADVADSPLAGSTPSPFAAEFRSEVDQAVRSWRFLPARYRRFRPGEDSDHDGKPDYKLVTFETPITVYIDVRFDFTVVEGRGLVTPSTAQPDPP